MGAGERCEVWVALKFLSSLGGRHSIDVSQSIVRTSASQTCEALILKVFLYESGSLEPRGQHLGPPPPDQLPLSLDNSLFYFLIILIPGALRELKKHKPQEFLTRRRPRPRGEFQSLYGGREIQINPTIRDHNVLVYFQSLSY